MKVFLMIKSGMSHHEIVSLEDGEVLHLEASSPRVFKVQLLNVVEKKPKSNQKTKGKKWDACDAKLWWAVSTQSARYELLKSLDISTVLTDEQWEILPAHVQDQIVRMKKK